MAEQADANNLAPIRNLLVGAFAAERRRRFSPGRSQRIESDSPELDTAQRSERMQQWEYFKLVVRTDDRLVLYFDFEGKRYKESAILHALNELGDAGWELVSSIPNIRSPQLVGTCTMGYDLIFKRPKA
jgi:hypothetical protein